MLILILRRISDPECGEVEKTIPFDDVFGSPESFLDLFKKQVKIRQNLVEDWECPDFYSKWYNIWDEHRNLKDKWINSLEYKECEKEEREWYENSGPYPGDLIFFNRLIQRCDTINLDRCEVFTLKEWVKSFDYEV